MSKSWAIPTWLFLHTMVAQVSEEKYASIKEELVYQIKNICAVLPCPDCAQHATQYLSGLKLSHVPTKDALQTALWRFHNTVNAKTGKPVFPLDKMDIYARSNLRVMYAVFIQEFTKPVRNPKLIMDVLARDRVIARFKQWMANTFGLR
jgi:hypothetical protein